MRRCEDIQFTTTAIELKQPLQCAEDWPNIT
jgi:hypothetical protein